ncbi:hypothetical protein QTI24_20800 [Variovorax sp. J22P240]|uniref:hypothetical protein n=1 Tax=Variovorax sp. J22P240 TaxID=3053514 RepID=UPI002578E751|nr:hypothetical protein [Variovorax sp. J22P240]MDM0001061.1 hypothetical protein [Variovorax sp. J22P240]
MTQRMQSPTPSSDSVHIPSADSTPRDAMEAVWRWGYLAICLIAIAAAGVIAKGGAAHVELELATAAITARPVFQDICSASGDQRHTPPDSACAKAPESQAAASALC